MAIREYTNRDVSDILANGFDVWDAEQAAKLDQEAEREATMEAIDAEMRARRAHHSMNPHFLLNDKTCVIALAFIENRWRYGFGKPGQDRKTVDWQGRFQFFDDAINAALRAYAATRFSGDVT